MYTHYDAVTAVDSVRVVRLRFHYCLMYSSRYISPITSVVQVEHSVRCVCLCVCVCPDNNFWTKWLSTYRHLACWFISTLSRSRSKLGQVHRSKFTVTGGNCCQSGRCDIERGTSSSVFLSPKCGLYDFSGVRFYHRQHQKHCCLVNINNNASCSSAHTGVAN